MKIIKIVLTLALGMPALFGQTYSQPVREVQKEAYSAIDGSCTTSWIPSQNDTIACTALTVPADKILAIRGVSVFCTGRTGDSFAASLQSLTSHGSSYRNVYFPLLSTAPTESSQHQIARAAYTPVFVHAAPSTPVRLVASFDGQKVGYNPATCRIIVDGYFLPAVQ